MKIIITVFIIGISSFIIQAQNVFDKKQSQEQRQQDLINFIKSDIDLYSHYKSGKKNLKTAKALGITSVVFLTSDLVILLAASSANDVGSTLALAALFLLSSSVAIITGTIGLVLRSKGKGKIRDVMEYADRQINSGYSIDLNIQATSNGVGLVYCF